MAEAYLGKPTKEQPPYNPGLISGLETARYIRPGTEEYVGELIATGVEIAETIVERASQTQAQRELDRFMYPHSGRYYQGQLDATAEQLHRLISLSKDPDLDTTANDWGQVLLCEAWYRAEQAEAASPRATVDVLAELPPPTRRPRQGLFDRVLNRLTLFHKYVR